MRNREREYNSIFSISYLVRKNSLPTTKNKAVVMWEVISR